MHAAVINRLLLPLNLQHRFLDRDVPSVYVQCLAIIAKEVRRHASTSLCMENRCHARTNFMSQHPFQPVLSRSGDIDSESGAAIHHCH